MSAAAEAAADSRDNGDIVMSVVTAASTDGGGRSLDLFQGDDEEMEVRIEYDIKM